MRSASQDSTPDDHTSVRTERPQVSAALHRARPRIIDGNVAGTTEVVVADANKGPGNKESIPVIFVNGPGVPVMRFFLKKPIDTGFFNYDLFFRPTGSSVFELRSFLGGAFDGIGGKAGMRVVW